MNSIDGLIEDYVARLRRGESPNLEDYAHGHPELATEIRAVFPSLKLLEEVRVEPQPLDMPPPRQLGEFTILREVARGGMGIVYEAVQESLGRHVALKVFRSDFRARPAQLERFQLEARAAARLHHTNIVPVFGVGEHDGIPFYAMQFIRGQSLAAIIDEMRRAPGKGSSSLGSSHGQATYFANIARIGIQAAEALEHAHQQGILHRDIKPANLLLDAQSTLWITDFGLAKSIDSEPITETGDVLGTLAYMAPEQLDGRSDARTDIYALGLTLYELLTLTPPFRDEVRVRLIEKVRRGNPVLPRSIDPRIPADLQTIVVKCLATGPSLRYANAGELAKDLSRFLDGRSILARRPSRMRQLRQWCVRNPGAASLLMAVGTLTVGMCVLFAIAYVREKGLNTELAASIDNERIANAEAEKANRELREAVRSDKLSLARELSSRTRLGRRTEAIEQLKQAAAIRPDADLRTAAFGFFSLIDLKVERDLAAPETIWVGRMTRDFTPDLAHVANFDRDAVVVRHVDSGKAVARILTSGRTPRGVRFSRDGRWLAVCYKVGLSPLEVWDWTKSQKVYTNGDRTDFRSYDFSPDGKLLAIGMAGNLVRYVDLPAFQENEPIQVGTPSKEAVSPWIFHFSPSGAHLLVGPVENRGIHAFAVLRPKDPKPALLAPSGEILYHANWFPNESALLVSAGTQVFVVPFDSKRPTIPFSRIPALTSPQPARGILFDPLGSVVFLDCGAQGPTRVYDLREFSLALELPYSPSRFDPTGARIGLVGNSTVSVAELLRPADWRIGINAAPVLQRNGILVPSIHPDVAIRAGVSNTSVVDLRTGKALAEDPNLWSTDGALVDTYDRDLFVSNRSGVDRLPIRIHERPGGSRLTIGPPNTFFRNPDAKTRVVKISANGETHVVYDGTKILAFNADRKLGRSIEIGVNQNLFALSADGRWLSLLDTKNSKLSVLDLSSESPPISLAVTDPLGATFQEGPVPRLFVASKSGVSIFEAGTWKQIREIELTIASPVSMLDISPDGKLLAVASKANEVCLIRLSDGLELARLPISGSQRFSVQLQFTADGRRLISNSFVQDACVWDLVQLRRNLRSANLEWPNDDSVPRDYSPNIRPIVLAEILKAKP